MIRPSWISPRIGQFILVGGIAASIHLGVVVYLVELYSVSPLQANLLGFFVSFCFSFLGQRFLTFRVYGPLYLVILLLPLAHLLSMKLFLQSRCTI
jgi:putative flippase GtrA